MEPLLITLASSSPQESLSISWSTKDKTPQIYWQLPSMPVPTTTSNLNRGNHSKALTLCKVFLQLPKDPVPNLLSLSMMISSRNNCNPLLLSPNAAQHHQYNKKHHEAVYLQDVPVVPQVYPAVPAHAPIMRKRDNVNPTDQQVATL